MKRFIESSISICHLSAMNQFWAQHRPLKLVQICLGGCFSGLLLVGGGVPAWAQSLDLTTTDLQLNGADGTAQGDSIVPLRYQLPQNYSLGDFSKTGAPQRRGSAGSRGDCPAPGPEQLPAQAILPLAPGQLGDQTIDVAFGTTTSSHPTFWFNIPYTTEQVNNLELVIVAAESQALLGEISIDQAFHPKQPGLWGFQWPSMAAELAVGQRYQWFLVVECASEYGSGLLMSGLVERQELPLDLAKAIAQASPRDRVALYARNGIWHEAITELNQLRTQEPNNLLLQQDWMSLLDSIDFEAAF